MKFIRQWPQWSGYAAAGWSLLYGLAGLYWSVGGAGFPFAPIDEDYRSGSLLEGADARMVAPIMAVTGAVGAVIGVLMTRVQCRFRVYMLGFAWALAVTLALIIPDYSLIALVALAPFILVFAFTGVPGDQGGVGDILYWHRMNLVILFVGGVLWATAALAYQRRTAGNCAHCGRNDRPSPQWMSSPQRWGRWAVWVAVASCLPYEITRVAWFLGYPLGIPDSFERMMQDTPGMLEMGLGLAIASALGGVLTHGLVHRWGEVYPRWIWFKAGQRVPPALAIVPASIVAAVLIPAGLMNLQLGFDADSWAVNAPGVLWVVWGAALGAATLAYHLRRRGPCRHCHRGAAGPCLPRDPQRAARPPSNRLA
ncbi:hypothetical protein J4573_02260 [Actinomadura barringtoniae]|uniref:Uncharacterized protein n=1 Tax=Actinomadura barringtoniae TaxID=1427535 RepID=A0A939P5V5_9ACTN|nr:hypothetical protein [Actinomadura barringtoniae]MBO2445902.1 hypothetical protein [Actinomadura barringtoniae]